MRSAAYTQIGQAQNAEAIEELTRKVSYVSKKVGSLPKRAAA